MKKQRFMDLSMLICPECGKSFPIMRNHGQRRERGHVKDIWCPYCKADRKFKEVGRKGYMTTASGSVIYM